MRRTNGMKAVCLATTVVALAVVPASSASGGAGAVLATWRANLERGAQADPGRRFPNPPVATLLSRLHRASRRYGFRIVRVEILRPRQQAPLVVIESAQRRALAAHVPALLHMIDPKAYTGDDRTGWAYEGFFLEAQDASGTPFLATFNWWRGAHVGGGQWASSPALYPFAHG